jgi:hypothetical protein
MNRKQTIGGGSKSDRQTARQDAKERSRSPHERETPINEINRIRFNIFNVAKCLSFRAIRNNIGSQTKKFRFRYSYNNTNNFNVFYDPGRNRCAIALSSLVTVRII